MNPNIIVVEFSKEKKSFRMITAKAMIDVNIQKILNENVETDFIPIGFFKSQYRAISFIEEFIDAMYSKKDPIVEFNEIVNQCK